MANDALISRAKDGDADAFEEIVREYEKTVYNLALRYCGNSHDAYDISQDVFLRVYRSIDTFKGQSKFSTWLFQLATNICIDYCRKNSRRKEVGIVLSDDDGDDTQLDIPDESQIPEKIYEELQLRDDIAKCIDKLSDEHRMVLVLRDIDGMSYNEICDILGVELGTVKSRLFRAREKLRSILIKSGNFSEYISSYKATGGERHDC